MNGLAVFGALLGAFTCAFALHLLIGPKRRKAARATVKGVRAVRRKRKRLDRAAKVKTGKPVRSTRGTVHRTAGNSATRMVCGTTLRQTTPGAAGTRCAKCWGGR